MKDLPNIERSAFKRGQYVGYGAGTWRIFRSGDHWCAVRRPHGFLTASTLADMSQRISQFAMEEHAVASRKE